MTYPCVYVCIPSLGYSSTHLPIHPSSHSLIHSYSHQFIHLFIHLFTYVHSFMQCLYWVMGSLLAWLLASLLASFVCWFVSLIDCVHVFIYNCVSVCLYGCNDDWIDWLFDWVPDSAPLNVSGCIYVLARRLRNCRSAASDASVPGHSSPWSFRRSGTPVLGRFGSQPLLALGQSSAHWLRPFGHHYLLVCFLAYLLTSLLSLGLLAGLVANMLLFLYRRLLSFFLAGFERALSLCTKVHSAPDIGTGSQVAVLAFVFATKPLLCNCCSFAS